LKQNLPYVFLIGFLVLLLVVYDINHGQYIQKASSSITRLIDNSGRWNKKFNEVQISSKFSNDKQLAYFYKSKGENPKPLVVSLHTWGGDYAQEDELSQLCVENNINYIHPNFNGPNNNSNSCCSQLVIGQIDEAINYAVENSNVDKQNIHVIGLSGGGYTAFCHYLLSKLSIKSYQSWVGISDLESWYYQSISQENSYWKDILACTDSKDGLNSFEAKKRSPLHMGLSSKKVTIPTLNIYTGIHDGNRGAVPITHSINFYNKIVRDLYSNELHRMVTIEEKLALLENRKTLGSYGMIGNRDVFFAKKKQKVNLFVFDGAHEILPEYAIMSIL